MVEFVFSVREVGVPRDFSAVVGDDVVTAVELCRDAGRAEGLGDNGSLSGHVVFFARCDECVVEVSGVVVYCSSSGKSSCNGDTVRFGEGEVYFRIYILIPADYGTAVVYPQHEQTFFAGVEKGFFNCDVVIDVCLIGNKIAPIHIGIIKREIRCGEMDTGRREGSFCTAEKLPCRHICREGADNDGSRPKGLRGKVF